jgi:Ca2+-binding EF-hand superfamily protein
MKRLSSLVLSSIFGISIIAGCSSNEDLIPLQNTVPQQNVAVQSNLGLTAFYDFMIKTTFNVIDINKDKYITLQEFAPELPTPAPSASSAPSASIVNPAVKPLPDSKTRFIKLDTNKDGKVSMAEIKKNPKYFLGINKTDYRKSVKYQFDYLNTDKNGYVSRTEFLALLGNQPYDVTLNLTALFISSDLNKNGSLSFSEYEDLFYAQVEAYGSTVHNPPSPAPVDPSSIPTVVPSDTPDSPDPVPVPVDTSNPVPGGSADPNAPTSAYSY